MQPRTSQSARAAVQRYPESVFATSVVLYAAQRALHEVAVRRRSESMSSQRDLDLPLWQTYKTVMRGVVADPKTDVVFERIFGDEKSKPLLIARLNGAPQ
jgi:hypothetical protein